MFLISHTQQHLHLPVMIQTAVAAIATFIVQNKVSAALAAIRCWRPLILAASSLSCAHLNVEACLTRGAILVGRVAQLVGTQGGVAHQVDLVGCHLLRVLVAVPLPARTTDRSSED